MTGLPPLNIPQILRQYGIHPRKSLGQNFLVDDTFLQKIISVADINPSDTVLEIGPGLGSLTRHLSLASRSVIAVELDADLFPALEAILAPYKNVKLVQADILQIDPSSLIESPNYLVVANIPYYITSAVIRHLLEGARHPRRIVLTIQQEVANRICAMPGDMSLLALSVQVYGLPQIHAHIPARAFHPSPKVDSTVLTIDIYPQPIIPSRLLDTFFILAKAGFSQKRKTLRNSLSAGMRIPPGRVEIILNKMGINPQRRAETLDITEWGKLSDMFLKTRDDYQ